MFVFFCFCYLLRCTSVSPLLSLSCCYFFTFIHFASSSPLTSHLSPAFVLNVVVVHTVHIGVRRHRWATLLAPTPTMIHALFLDTSATGRKSTKPRPITVGRCSTTAHQRWYELTTTTVVAPSFSTPSTALVVVKVVVEVVVVVVIVALLVVVATVLSLLYSFLVHAGRYEFFGVIHVQLKHVTQQGFLFELHV